MEKRDYFIILYDFYGSLFNQNQKTYFEEYYFNNLSLGEISQNYHISRNAVHKNLKQIVEKLNHYEENLKLYAKHQQLNKIISQINDNNIKNKLKELF